MSGLENNVSGGDIGTPGTVWRRAENSRNVRIRDAEHLVAQQAPAAVAEVVREFIKEKHDEGPGMKAKM